MIQVNDKITVYVKKGENTQGTITKVDGDEVFVEYQNGNAKKSGWFPLKISGRGISYVAEKK
jgi:hypothetical protein